MRCRLCGREFDQRARNHWAATVLDDIVQALERGEFLADDLSPRVRTRLLNALDDLKE